MLTGYQCETIAFGFEGDTICVDCAVDATSAITVAKAERGLSHGGGDLYPLSRYALDEYVGERTWEDAAERVRDFRYRHPVIWAGLLERHTDAEWRLTDRVASHRPWIQCCDHCGEEIDS